ncbi:MAG: Na+/H+ antiporter [Thermomicrobiales bacterium]
MSEVEAILVLLAATTALVALARRFEIPYPILLVLGGLALGFMPGLPRVELKPELVFVLILPPILQSAAFFTPVRDFRAQIRPILSLAVGLVLFTTCAVAVVAHWAIDGLSWPSAFVLGAIVSPTDAVAATSIAQRLGLPRRIVSILEGESLVNDASGLVAYRVAVVAAVTGGFSFTDVVRQFTVAVVVGLLVGYIVGRIVAFLLRSTDDASIGIAISLLAPYGAYLLTERLHGSGVLAVVVGGFMMSRVFFQLENPLARLQGVNFWDMFIFLLNGFVFILIGVQLPDILDGISGYSWSTLVLYAAAVSLTAIIVRIGWVFLTSDPKIRFWNRTLACTTRADRPELMVIAWAGMRGVVSLAAALALKEDIPGRDLIIFLTFALIVVTLVGQGLTLAPLIRALEIPGDMREEQEELEARSATARAARARLDELAQEEWVIDEVVQDFALHVDRRAGRIDEQRAGSDGEQAHEEVAVIFERIQRELLRAELDEAVRLRNLGRINDETLRKIQRDLDVELIRLGRR